MKHSAVRLVLGWSVVLVCLAGTSFAAKTTSTNKNATTKKAATLPTVDSKSVDAALAKAEAARAKASAAEEALLRIVDKLQIASNASAEYQAALAEQHSAHEAYLVIVQPLLDAEAAKPEYKAAVAEKGGAEAELQKLQADSASTSEQITAGAQAVLDAGTHITKMQTEALANNQAVAEARDRQTAADTKIAQLDAAFQASVRNDPEWIAARQALDEAKAAEIAADDAYAAALAKAAQQEAAREAAIEAQKQKVKNQMQVMK